MARIRTIKPEFFRHEVLQGLGPIPMLFFTGLWTQADKAGNFPWRPAQLKLDILPFIEYDVSSTLEVLRIPGFVIPYTGDDGKAYGHIPNFDTHQRFFGSEIKSPPRFPAFSAIKQEKEALKVYQGSTLEVPRTVESGIRNQENGIRNDLPPKSGEQKRQAAKEKKIFPPGSFEYDGARFFWQYLKDWSPSALEPAESGYQNWARDLDAMFRLDKRTPTDYNELLDWIDTRPQRGNFAWRNVVQSPGKLRENWRAGKFADFLPSSLQKQEFK